NLAALGTDDEKYKRDLKFKDRLTGLLLRAQIGFDYRKPLITENTYRNTIIRTATGKGAVTHLDGAWFKQELWVKANKLVVDCIGLLARIGFLPKAEVEECKTALKTNIQQLCILLPSQKGRNPEHPEICLDKDTKIKVGRSLDKALETINAYIAGIENPPDDPSEILTAEGNIVVSTQQPPR
ncbi:MAG: hypothetical protein LBJ96_02765, partial [Holosporaceae bacterium]|nr:hypothetical protein [Holosporaceae bacterium]